MIDKTPIPIVGIPGMETTMAADAIAIAHAGILHIHFLGYVAVANGAGLAIKLATSTLS